MFPQSVLVILRQGIGEIEMILRAWLRPAIAALMAVFAPTVSAEPAPPPPLEAYGDLPGVEDMALSPNGKGVAMVGRIEGERRLVVFEGQKLRAVTALGPAKLRSVQWAGDDLVTAVISSTENLGLGFTADRIELYGAVILPLDGAGKPQLVFSRNQSIARATFGNFGTRLIDGKWKGYFGGIELMRDADRTAYVFDHGRPALYAVDLASNTPRKLAFAPSAAGGQAP